MKKILFILALSILMISQVSAVVVNSVYAETFSPGQEATIRIEIENILNDDVTDLTLKLNFNNLPFIPIGTSEQTLDELRDDDSEDFLYTVKASPTITPGDYQIPYTYSYEYNNEVKTNSGVIGIKVVANPILSYSVDTENAIVGQQGSITLKVVNKGFSGAKFVSVRILPEKYTLLSENEVYIGEIDSDDFQTAKFDVIFNDRDTKFSAILEYIDFDNKKVIENLNLPLRVYTPERAQELGLTQKSNSGYIFMAVITLILLIILWRILKKRKRLNRSMRKE